MDPGAESDLEADLDLDLDLFSLTSTIVSSTTRVAPLEQVEEESQLVAVVVLSQSESSESVLVRTVLAFDCLRNLGAGLVQKLYLAGEYAGAGARKPNAGPTQNGSRAAALTVGWPSGCERPPRGLGGGPYGKKPGVEPVEKRTGAKYDLGRVGLSLATMTGGI